MELNCVELKLEKNYKEGHYMELIANKNIEVKL